MNVLILGGGVVGAATGLGLRRLGHGIQVVDPNPGCLAAQRGLPVRPGGWAGEPEIIFICVPEKVIDKAALMLHQVLFDDDPAIFIRSSVPPGTCRRLSRELGRPFSHNPEFLRAAVAEYEFLNPPAIIIGSDATWSDKHRLLNSERLEELYRPLRVPVYHTDTATSELLKLAVNSYLACQVSFWNTMTLIADKLGVNGQALGMLASHCDERVSVYGSRMSGASYGGTCLPKDLTQLMDVAKGHGVPTPLLEAIKAVNDDYIAKEKICASS